MATPKLSEDEKRARAEQRERAKLQREVGNQRRAGIASPAIGGVVESLPENGTVTVGCKIPQGLILQLSEMVDASEPVLGGGVRNYKIAKPGGERVVLKGTGRAIAAVAGKAVGVNEYALTTGVSADFFRRWLEQNADSEIVKKELVFAIRDEFSARDKGRDLIGQRTGFEALSPKSKANPKGDPRVPRPGNPQLTELEELDAKS